MPAGGSIKVLKFPVGPAEKSLKQLTEMNANIYLKNEDIITYILTKSITNLE